MPRPRRLSTSTLGISAVIALLAVLAARPGEAHADPPSAALTPSALANPLVLYSARSGAGHFVLPRLQVGIEESLLASSYVLSAPVRKGYWADVITGISVASGIGFLLEYIERRAERASPPAQLFLGIRPLFVRGAIGLAYKGRLR